MPVNVQSLEATVKMLEEALTLARATLASEASDTPSVAPFSVCEPASAINPADVEELRRGWLRYEKVRKLNPRQYGDMWTANEEGVSFDDRVDRLPRPSTPMPNERRVRQERPFDRPPVDRFSESR